MFKSYWKIALRSIAKNKLYAFINILGLAIGLTVYLFGGMLAEYEKNHDVMFKNQPRVYTVGSVLTPDTDIGVKSLNNTYTAIAPHIENELLEAELVARTVRREFLLSNEDKHFHERVWFADSALTEIFDFDYIHGTNGALAEPNGLILTRDSAIKIFGSVDIVGKELAFNHDHSLYVSAVIENLPNNSHFNSSFLSGRTEIIAPLAALNRMTGWDLAGNWNNISGGNQVYVMTKEPMDLSELTRKLNLIYDSHVPTPVKEGFMASLSARNLKDANTAVWDMIGMPVIESVQVLGLLILVIAIVNYTNLATAQSMGRSREVGLRKTLGANKAQLMMQFLFESVAIAIMATIIALVMLELLIPIFNASLTKVLVIDYINILPWILLTAVTVGIVAGLYPSYLITKVSPINALKNMTQKGAKGNWFRSVMLGTQFMLSIFMLASVFIVLFQNQQVQQSAKVFPNDEVVVLKRTDVQLIKDREGILQNELLKLPTVKSVTFASQVPFEQSNNGRGITKIKGDVDNEVGVNIINVDHDFLSTFDVNILAGRDFSRAVLADEQIDNEKRVANVIVNQLMSQKLGFAQPADIVGQTIWGMPGEQGAFQYNVIGVMEDKNFLGLHNRMKAWMISIPNVTHMYGAIRITPNADANTIAEIEAVWKKVIPEYPIDHDMLSGLFNDVYEIYKAMSSILAGFASIALLLALIGLFGLAAFMAKGRTKEIGIRKVLGASIPQIVKLVLWQFSKPVMWAILFALPLAFFASNMYLQFFAERIGFQIPLIIVAGVIAVGLAWCVIALHAFKVAKANPIKALRYE